MTWELTFAGIGNFEKRLKIAERLGVTRSKELSEIRNLNNTIKSLSDNLETFLDNLRTSVNIKSDSKAPKITIKLKVINSKTFVPNRCIAWIKKAHFNCYGQCGKKVKEGRFCGFHCASKQTMKCVSTIYDHMDEHVLHSSLLHLNLVSNKSSYKNVKDNILENSFMIYWRGLDIYINPESKKIYYKFSDNVRFIGNQSDDEEMIYQNYLRQLDIEVN